MGLEPLPPIQTGAGLPPITIATPVPIVGSGGAADPGSVTAALGKVVAFAASIEAWLQSYTGALVSQLASAVKSALATIAAWLKQIADSWLGQTIKAMWARIVAIYKAIAAEMKLIIETIRKYEAMVEAWETKILKPAMDLIQRIRRVLVVFRLFHFKFAATLDNYLAAREAQLAKIWIDTRREVNRVLDYLNLIFDPFGYFSPVLYLGSAIKSAGQLFAVLWNTQTVQLSSAQTAAGKTASSYANADVVQQRMVATAATGVQPIDQANVDAGKDALRRLGYTVV